MNTQNKNIGELNTRKRFNKSFWINTLAILLGVAIALIFFFDKIGKLNLSDNSYSWIITAFTVIIFYLSWLYLKNLDEFEQKRMGEACILAYHVGFLILPWHLLHEKGIVNQEPDAYFMIICMSLTALAYYYGLKLFGR